MRDPFEKILEEWKSPPEIPEDFCGQVWQRIAGGELNSRGAGVRRNRAIIAILGAAAVVVAGFGLGLMSGERAADGERANYFNRIDPIAQAR